VSSSGQSERKAELRALARRIGATDRTAAATAAIRRLVELPEFARARTIAFYSAIGDEVPVEQAAAVSRAHGLRTAYPLCTPEGLELAVSCGEEFLRRGPGGIGEPSLEAERVSIDEVDAFVVPGLLFDRTCRRLGRGGGHYDRLLKQVRADATSIGVCYAERVVDELPEDPWDVAMDLIVTDRFTLRRSNPEGAS